MLLNSSTVDILFISVHVSGLYANSTEFKIYSLPYCLITNSAV